MSLTTLTEIRPEPPAQPATATMVASNTMTLPLRVVSVPERLHACSGDRSPGRASKSLQRLTARRLLMAALGVSAPFSFFLPWLGSVAPLVSFLGFFTAYSSLRPTTIVRGALPAALLLTSLAVATVAWSPSVQQALQTALYFAQVAALIMTGSALVRCRADLLLFVRCWTMSAAVDAALVIYFRFQPAAEIAWLRSSVAPLFINPRTLERLFADSPNNVLDPDKSGAFFVNANAGSAFLGAAFLASMFLYSNTRRRGWLVIAVLDALGVVASGSSAGILLLSAALAVGLIVLSFRSVMWCYMTPLIILTALGSFIYLVPAVWRDTSAWDRMALWQLAVRAIEEHPLKGLGYGGWEIYAGPSFSAIGSATYPPHNLLLYTWIQMGAIGLIGGVWLYVCAFRALRRVAVPGMAYIIGALVWSIVYAMGDNTQLLNDTHSAPLFAVLVGVGARSGRGVGA